MLRIAHISDLHIRFKDENKLQNRFIKLLENIAKNKCNHLIITGDISDSSDVRDLKKVKSFLRKYKFDSPDNLSVTIGNHDIFGGARKGPDVYLFPSECKKTNYDSRARNFDKVISPFKEFNNNLNNLKTFPEMKILTERIVLISLNSIAKWSANLNPTASNGLVDKAEIRSLETLLKNKVFEDKFKIVLIHHHFREPDFSKLNDAHSLWLYSERHTMKLHNKDELIDLFNHYKVDLILHGHTHITESYKIHESRFLNSSGCLMPFTDDRINQYHIITFPNDESNPFNFKIEKITF